MSGQLFGIGLQEQGIKPGYAAVVKSNGREQYGKAVLKMTGMSPGRRTQMSRRKLVDNATARKKATSLLT